MQLRIGREVREHAAARQGFFILAEEVFGLSFRDWYAEGWWGDAYCPYTLFDGDKAVANVSVNLIRTQVQGKLKLYVQLGTVMTAPEYRGRGFACQLMEKVLADWERACDGIYLYANETVLEFYPKFGFEKAFEYRYQKAIKPLSEGFTRLPMDSRENVDLLKRCYDRGEPFSDRPMLENFGLLMFYCGGPMKDCVVYSRELDCAAVISYGEDASEKEMTCYGLFGGADRDMEELLSAVARLGTEKLFFGFLPKDKTGCEVTVLQPEDDQLFVYGAGEPGCDGLLKLLRSEPILLPLLSHA